MPIAIDSVMQLGIGWEVTFRPPDQGDALARFLAGHGLRVVSHRTENRPEGDMGCLEVEQPGGELPKRDIVRFLGDDPAFDLTHLRGVDRVESDFADEG